MTRQAQKQSTAAGLPLKLAIIASQRKQRDIAQRARIPEVRLSKIVTGRGEATVEEQQRLAKVLRCDAATLFPLSDPLPTRTPAADDVAS